MPAPQSKTFFFLGLGGAGMRALAALLHAQGHTIVGTDTDLEKISLDPAAASYQVAPESTALSLLSRADMLVYTDAAPATHTLRHAAQAQGIPQQMLFAAVGEFSRGFTTIAVTGTHGKSSTTAMLAHILERAGLDPTVQVGASVPGWVLGNARAGTGKYFIVEADEYRRHFLHLHPAHAIITAIDFDHPDYFHSPSDVVAAYHDFLKRVAPTGWVITTEAVKKSHPDLPWPTTTLAVPVPTTKIPLVLPGTHMQHNAALAIALAEKLDVDRSTAQKALAAFPGLSRRFEAVGKIGDMQLISDYGHHPTEIAATLQAAHESNPQEKILAIIEPHTTERVHAFLDAFTTTLKSAPIDGVIIYPTFYVKGRENEGTAVASSQKLFDALKTTRPNVWHVKDDQELKSLLSTLSTQYDTAIAFSAGSLDAVIRSLKS